MKNQKPSAVNGTKDKQAFVELLVNNNNQEIQSLPTKNIDIDMHFECFQFSMRGKVSNTKLKAVIDLLISVC